MAMARPLVCSPLALQGLDFPVPPTVQVADDAAAFAARTAALLESTTRTAAPANRDYVLRYYDWATNLRAFLDLVDGAAQRAAAHG
jgi:hypothetical protein